jgi:hypothetical protein
MKSTDSETGETELINYRFLNPETGETIQESGTNCAKKTKFQIPKSYLQPRPIANSQSEREQKCCLLATKETYTLTRKEKGSYTPSFPRNITFFMLQFPGNNHWSQQDESSNVLDTHIDIFSTNCCTDNHHN